MNVFILKIIALTTMVIDHYGAIFQNDILIYRIIGRIAFPIYCFLLVEGYNHTSDVKKYAKRLIIFALVSEIPFDLAFYNKIGFEHQNIFFTLFLGLAVIYLLEMKEGKYNFNKTAVIIVACLLANILLVDYNVMGIVYILLFYITRSFNKSKKFMTIGLGMFAVNFMSPWVQQFSLIALIPIYFYNGELGPKNKIMQILFYAAYPLHLVLYYFMKVYFNYK